MADYWKSQPRKFCQYCKCWIADNKPSIEFHERGKNHKENVAAKISEIKKKSVQKAKQEARMGKQFAAMEEAAMKAYEEDLKRMEREAAFGPEAETTSTTSTYQPVPTVQPPKQPQANKQEPKEKKEKKPPKKIPHPRPPPSQHPQHSGAALWVEGKSGEGYTYYYNTVTGESRWNKPEETKREASHLAPPGTTETSFECVWMQAVSPEGYTYYYNTVTGASSWEKPAGYIPKGEPGSSEQGKGQEEESNTEKAVKAEEGEEATSEQPSTQTEATEQSTDPKIQFRKRKAEADSSEETSKTPEETPKESEEESKQEDSGTTESEKKEEKQDETPTGRFRPPNPYGTWERIKMEKDPYASVDWQLPQVQGGEDSATVDLPPEPKHKFKTRVITSLGDSASSSGPVAFKKKKVQNGKSRSLRQRDEDD